MRVHDALRPRPPVVDPGPGSKAPTRAPKDATVLFDGTNLEAWKGRKGAAKWKLVEDGAMEVNRTGDIQTKAEFGDCQLHVHVCGFPLNGSPFNLTVLPGDPSAATSGEHCQARPPHENHSRSISFLQRSICRAACVAARHFCGFAVPEPFEALNAYSSRMLDSGMMR